jgi:serine/threonine protein kinase
MNEDGKTRIRPEPTGIREEDATLVSDADQVADATRIAPPSRGGNAAAVQLSEATRIAQPTSSTDRSVSRPQGLLGIKPGALIKDRFLLLKQLGSGGMGVVYSARDLVHEEAGEKDSVVAIKLLSESFKEHPNALRMLQQETKKSRELAHPNIVNVYDFDRDGEIVYMTMELLSGHSLEDYLKLHQSHKAKPEEVWPIIRDIARGLMYAHEQNIIHSDLKPSNIFLTKKGAKILDFGIARAAMQTEGQVAEAKPDESGEVFALTPAYASLEMFLGEPPDPRDDIYAFACICYQLLTNNHPFNKRSAEEVYSTGQKPKKIDWIKERQWQGLLKALALQRANRMPTVGKLLDSLLPKRKEPWKLASAALALVAMLSLGYYFFRPTVVVAPNLFENPPPAEELSPARLAEVNDVLEVAEVHMMVGRLLSPPGGNALDEYRKVLEMHPYNRRAIAGLRALVEQLTQQARSSLQAGDRKKASELVQEGLNIHGKNPQLLALQKELENQP